MRSVQWTVSMKSHHEILDNLSVTKPLDTLILAFKSNHYEEILSNSFLGKFMVVLGNTAPRSNHVQLMSKQLE